MGDENSNTERLIIQWYESLDYCHRFNHYFMSRLIGFSRLVTNLSMFLSINGSRCFPSESETGSFKDSYSLTESLMFYSFLGVKSVK